MLRQYFSRNGALLLYCRCCWRLLSGAVIVAYIIGDLLNIQSRERRSFSRSVYSAYAVVVLTVVTTFLAGFYPALVVSGYQPILALKGKMRTAGNGQSNLRRGLISFAILHFAGDPDRYAHRLQPDEIFQFD